MPSTDTLPISCAHCKLRSYCETRPFDYRLIELSDDPPDLSWWVCALLGMTPLLMLWVLMLAAGV